MTCRWTDSRITLLQQLTNEGWSASQIADKIGVTRNAVIGKLHRLGDKLRGFVNGQSGMARPPRTYEKRMTTKVTVTTTVPEPTPAPSKPVPAAVPTAPITLMDLKAGDCKWPTNDGRPEFLFCGQPQAIGLPYCPDHARKAYSPTKK